MSTVLFVSPENIGRLSEAISNIQDAHAAYDALVTNSPSTLQQIIEATVQEDEWQTTFRRVLDRFVDILFEGILPHLPRDTQAQRIGLLHAGYTTVLNVMNDPVHGFKNHNPTTTHRKEVTLAVDVLEMALGLVMVALSVVLSDADKSRFDVLVASLREFSLGQEL